MRPLAELLALALLLAGCVAVPAPQVTQPLEVPDVVYSRAVRARPALPQKPAAISPASKDRLKAIEQEIRALRDDLHGDAVK